MKRKEKVWKDNQKDTKAVQKENTQLNRRQKRRSSTRGAVQKMKVQKMKEIKKQKICQGLSNFFIRFDDVADTYQISLLSYFFVNNLGSDENNIKNYFSWTQYKLRRNV